MALHRVTWVSQFTKRVNHHDAEELDVAQAHLAFLCARHPIIEYTLEPAPAWWPNVVAIATSPPRGARA